MISLVGIFFLIIIALVISKNRFAINLRTVICAFLIQITFGALVLYVPQGRAFIIQLAQGFEAVIGYSNQGIRFLFGGLVSEKMFELFGHSGFVFALRILPTIIFFSALTSMLYYFGIMQWLIRILGGVLHKGLKTSKIESLSATANIFIGLAETPVMLRPYLATMTRSELFAIMCGSLATVAGYVLIGYSALGVPMQYLVAASFMAAPGGLLFAKLIVPEIEKPLTQDAQFDLVEQQKHINAIDAASSGAVSGLYLALHIGAMLIAFISLIALLNGFLGWAGSLLDYPDFSLQQLLGYLFAPIAYLIGIPWEEAAIAGALIGEKLVINEFVAFSHFSPYLQSADAVIAAGLPIISEKSKVIISFALCGFANLGSISILLGGITVLAPQRRSDIASLGLYAVVAATLSNLMSAAMAGFFFHLTQ